MKTTITLSEYYFSLLVALAFILFASSMFMNVAHACSPAVGWPYTISENIEKSESVFVGIVTEADRVKGEYSDEFEISFEVHKTYKGNVQQTAIIRVAASSATCGYDTLDEFKEGSAWAIYLDQDGYTNSLSGNQKYESISSAIATLDAEKTQIACTREYLPVCGLRDTGIRCITTPCPSTEEKTYDNTCLMKADKATLLHAGACKTDSETEPVIKAEATCKIWFDGCNMCSRNEISGELACTKKACQINETPTCKEYFSNEVVIENEKNVKTLQRRIIEILKNIIDVLLRR